jgi:hypothetical protein
MSEIHPNNTDAILGGQNPPPVNAAVLGGKIGRKQRLQHEKAIARKNKFWQNFRALDDDILPNGHITMFVDRQVINFELGMEILKPKEVAYALRVPKSHSIDDTLFQEKLLAFIQDPNVSQVEVLVIGWCGWKSLRMMPSILAENKQYLTNLQAIFLGDIEDSEMMISNVRQGDMGIFLAAYPNLQILQIRASDYGLRFFEGLDDISWRHTSLKSLLIESGGLNRETLEDLERLELPALEYLELWMGREDYGGTSSIKNLMSIISGEKFPKLKYLGLKNCGYTDEVAFELAKSPVIESLLELDLSLGTLGMDGLLALANSPHINELDRLNISRNFVYPLGGKPGGYERCLQVYPEIGNIKCELIVNNQRPDDPRTERYCVVAERLFEKSRLRS